MKSGPKRALCTLLLYANFFLSIGLIGLAIYLFVMSFGRGKSFNTASLILAGICLAVQPILEVARQNLRQITDFDEFGMNVRFKNYKKLTREDKDRIDRQKLEDMERILSSNTLKKMTHKGSKSPKEDMDHLVGMDNVKREMSKMAAKMVYEKKDKKSKAETSMHMCFLGSPGTGKTTCARIMAGFLYQNGYIRKNQYIETDGVFLKGANAMETQQKVMRLVQFAMDGVLFIDEAYALAQYPDAISVLIKAMEDNRDRLVIIFAGYKKEMQWFLDANSGIYSRIKHYMVFEDYSPKELLDIFKSMAKEKKFTMTENAEIAFNERIHIDMQGQYFGNARAVRNILEQAIDNHYLNLQEKTLDQSERFVLHDCDIPKEAEFIF